MKHLKNKLNNDQPSMPIGIFLLKSVAVFLVACAFIFFLDHVAKQAYEYNVHSKTLNK